MKVLLIQPPIRDFYTTRFRNYPLGLLYIASALREEGVFVKILDARFYKKSKKTTLPHEFENISHFYKKENNLFVAYKHFGLSLGKIIDQISGDNYDYVLISSSFTAYADLVRELIIQIKLKFPHISVCVGGHHATCEPSYFDMREVDFVLRGEGERIFEFIKSAPSKKYNESIVRVSDIEKLAFPARDLILTKHYLYEKRGYTMLLTSRGCPHECVFCSTKCLSGTKFRVRSVESVLSEIWEASGKHLVSAFDFQDDNLLFEPERIKNLFEKIVQKYNFKNNLFMASNGLNVKNIDLELLELMKKIGFKKLDISLGTGNVPTREKLLRPETIGKYEDVLKKAIKLDLKVTTYIILGYPFQPLKEQIDTVKYLEEKNTLISPSVFYNVPGMQIFDEALKFEYTRKNISRRSSAFNNWGVDFDRDDIFKLFQYIRKINLKKL